MLKANDVRNFQRPVKMVFKIWEKQFRVTEELTRWIQNLNIGIHIGTTGSLIGNLSLRDSK
jgi:hypothetical protein